MASLINVVIAIDFGTTYCGYASSFADDYKNIHTGLINPGKSYSNKVPTSVLCDPSRNFRAFGHEAEDKYSELLRVEKAEGWSLFSQFKMILYKNQDLSENTTIMDITGTISMPAVDIFAMAIKYMKDHAIHTLQGWTISTNMTNEEIHYVINVPSIWDDPARQFMRRAAFRAGIPESNVSLVNASEAAAIWCQDLVLVSLDGKSMDVLKAGSKNMVVDIGGGTADITVHEKMDDGKLRKILQPSGGEWGSKQVDEAFLKILEDAVGREIVEAFKKESVADFLDMMHGFERAKRTIDDKSDITVNIHLTFAPDDTKKNATKSFIESLHKLDANNGISIEGNKLQMEAKLARGMFNYSVDGICQEIQSTLIKMDELNSIIVVGGFSESLIVREAIRSLLKERNIALSFPVGSDLSIMRGAVIYGHTPEVLE